MPGGGNTAGGDINHWRWMSKIRGFPGAEDEQPKHEYWHLAFQAHLRSKSMPGFSQGRPIVKLKQTEKRLFQMQQQQQQPALLICILQYQSNTEAQVAAACLGR